MNRTDLMNAALDGDLQEVGNLIERGADLHATDDRGWTALDLAAAYAATESLYDGYPRYEAVVKALLDAGSVVTGNTVRQVSDCINNVVTREIRQAGQAMLALLSRYQRGPATAREEYPQPEIGRPEEEPAEPVAGEAGPGSPPIADHTPGPVAQKGKTGRVWKVLLLGLLLFAVLAVLIPHLSK